MYAEGYELLTGITQHMKYVFVHKLEKAVFKFVVFSVDRGLSKDVRCIQSRSSKRPLSLTRQKIRD